MHLVQIQNLSLHDVMPYDVEIMSTFQWDVNTAGNSACSTPLSLLCHFCNFSCSQSTTVQKYQWKTLEIKTIMSAVLTNIMKSHIVSTVLSRRPIFFLYYLKILNGIARNHMHVTYFTCCSVYFIVLIYCCPYFINWFITNIHREENTQIHMFYIFAVSSISQESFRMYSPRLKITT